MVGPWHDQACGCQCGWWAQLAYARLEGLVLPKAATRFNIDWVWDGRPAVLQSRAIDSTGYVRQDQPIARRSRYRSLSITKMRFSRGKWLKTAKSPTCRCSDESSNSNFLCSLWQCLCWAAPALRGRIPRPQWLRGRDATPAEVKAWDIDVRPDFKGLPKEAQWPKARPFGKKKSPLATVFLASPTRCSTPSSGARPRQILSVGV